MDPYFIQMSNFILQSAILFFLFLIILFSIAPVLGIIFIAIGILALIGKVVWGITKLIVLPIVGGFLVLLLIGMLLLV